jgi:hypothetical protein
MIASRVPSPDTPSVEDLHARFLAILPLIEQHGRIYFRHVKCPDRRADRVAEMVALAWHWYVRLAQRGKDPSQFPTILAAYAARAVHNGRRLCGQERAKDVLSPRAQRLHDFVVETLPDRSTRDGSLVDEALHDNTRTPVPEQACFRIDFPEWLASLGTRNRGIAQELALGYRTRDVAAAHGLSAARVSQLRQELRDDWERFLGTEPSEEPCEAR